MAISVTRRDAAVREGDVQVVILAGGLATRLGSVTATRPKSMVDVAGKPFLWHQLRNLETQGINDIVLCIGHLGGHVRDYCDQEFAHLSRTYSSDGEVLLGTAGALRKAVPHLRDWFLLLYGDSYVQADLADVARRFVQSDAAAAMAVFRNEDRWDTSNVAVEDGWVVAYEKGRRGHFSLIDAGLLAFRRSAVESLPAGSPLSLDTDLLAPLVARRRVLAIELRDRFFEVGSTAGLEELRSALSSGARSFEGSPG